MSTINDRIVAFITKHGLEDTDSVRDEIADFVSGCWKDHFKFCLNDTVPAEEKVSKKVSKENKIEDPSECQERDDLRNCTSGTLNEYCKKNGLRIGGNKKEIMDRVWRHLQGNNSEEDISPRNKPKKEKKESVKHDCYGCTSKGTPCAVAATVEVDGQWFCWRHEETASEIIKNKGGGTSSSEKKPKTVEKTTEKKVSKKSKKPVVKEESEEESEQEPSELETDEE